MRVDFQVGAAVRNEEVEDGVEEETGFYHIPVSLYPALSSQWRLHRCLIISSHPAR